jgi:hypothetical protein
MKVAIYIRESGSRQYINTGDKIRGQIRGQGTNTGTDKYGDRQIRGQTDKYGDRRDVF